MAHEVLCRRLADDNDKRRLLLLLLLLVCYARLLIRSLLQQLRLGLRLHWIISSRRHRMLLRLFARISGRL